MDQISKKFSSWNKEKKAKINEEALSSSHDSSTISKFNKGRELIPSKYLIGNKELQTLCATRSLSRQGTKDEMQTRQVFILYLTTSGI